ncbi:MAG: CehA/McbA family metallohydrolase, partial [Chloroflexi bacterium]|nr:CehA/McbA family metallohydrolase [Chloroflexota bacterium]
TNVGDLTGDISGSSRDDTIVWVGSENRQHFLGHISLLGWKGQPIYPMCTGGPTEGYVGDGVWRAMSEWAEEAKAKGGVVVVPHFPVPYSEVIAEVVRGKVDGVELRDWWTPTMDTFAIHEWYRLLNCGYRVAAIGGTDKMSAGMPVGGVRTYADIGDTEFTFDNWGKAVRAGRTYTTSGPLLTFAADGCAPGDTLRMRKGGGHVRIEASAQATMPFHRLQVVHNGLVIAEAADSKGTVSLKIKEDVLLERPGWLAARCISEHTQWNVWPVKFGAHTSPVYVEMAGSQVFDGPTAEYLITVLEGGITWLNTLAIPATPERHRAIKKVFEDAIADIRAKMPADEHDGHVHSHGGRSHRH